MSISNAELYDVIGVCFECHQNATIASRIYSVRYPGRRHYDKEVLKRKARRLRETGFKRLALIQQNPHTVLRILKHHRLHPYQVVLHKALQQHLDARLDYGNWMLGMLKKQAHILSKILWTDEATFDSAGGVNLHNMHYLAKRNPHWMEEVQPQGKWSLNVWCGIFNGKIIGPYFFDETLIGDTYLDFLENQLPVLLEDIFLQTRS